MKGFTKLVALLVAVSVLGNADGKKIIRKASKDSSLYYQEEGLCGTTELPFPGCKSFCPFCNHGKDKTLAVEQFKVASTSIIGFTLKKVPLKGLKSCKIVFPAASPPIFGAVTGPQVTVTDVGFRWKEKKITFDTQPTPTAIGEYGLYDPWGKQAFDVTKGCIYALKNRKASGNGLAVTLELNSSAVTSPSYIIEFPSREAGSPAKLVITYHR